MRTKLPQVRSCSLQYSIVLVFLIFLRAARKSVRLYVVKDERPCALFAGDDREYGGNAQPRHLARSRQARKGG